MSRLKEILHEAVALGLIEPNDDLSNLTGKSRNQFILDLSNTLTDLLLSPDKEANFKRLVGLTKLLEELMETDPVHYKFLRHNFRDGFMNIFTRSIGVGY